VPGRLEVTIGILSLGAATLDCINGVLCVVFFHGFGGGGDCRSIWRRRETCMSRECGVASD